MSLASAHFYPVSAGLLVTPFTTTCVQKRVCAAVDLNLDANALSFAHIVLAYANFCSIKPESVMSNFPRHHSDFLIHFVLLFHLGM